MTRKRAVTTAVIILFAVAVIFLISILLFRQYAPENKPETVQNTQETQSSYLVQEYSGKIAVYRDGGSSPYRIYDVYVNTLPEYDRDLLAQGIPVETLAQLNRLIEDYTS